MMELVDNIEVNGDATQCRVDFTGDISLDIWNSKVNEIQTKIAALKHGDVYISVTRCDSCVPIAFVSLFLSIIRNKANATIWIASEGPKGGSYVYNLLSEMKIGRFCQENNIYIILDDEELDDYSKFNSYAGNCSSLCVFDCNQADIRQIIDGISEEIIVDTKEPKEPLIKIKNILHETVNNIKEHAYGDDDEAYAAVLVRRYQGETTNSNLYSNMEFRKLYSNRNREYYQQLEGMYEIIVIDEGVGIAATLKIKNNRGKNAKYPLSYSMTKTFIEDGSIEREGDYKSYYSGLNFIFKLMCENGDYVLGREKDEYVELRGTHNSPVVRTVFQNLTPYTGVAWVFHVAIKRADLENNKSVAGPYINGKNDKLLHELTNKDELVRRIRSSYIIIDEREYFREVQNEFVVIDRENISGTIWLTDAVRTKNSLLSAITKRCYEWRDNCQTLIVGDVIEHELTTFYCALNKWHCPNDFPCENIIVVSHGLRVQYFVRKENVFYLSKLRANSYWNSKGNSVKDSLVKYYNYIVKLDSSAFWSRVFQKRARDFLIVRGDIEWEGKPLSYYLNLEMILGDRELYGMIRHSLRRVTGLMEKESEFKSIDVVMKKMCIDLNYDYYKKEQTIYIGSVYVTGRTESIVETNPDDLKMCIFVNYFDNPDKTKGVNRLLIWPKKELLDERITYRPIKMKRRGNTPSLYIDDGKGTMVRFKNVRANFIRHYDDTMNDIDSLYGGFIRLGHFNYHNNHDIFSINQREIIKTSAYEKQGIFCYLFEQFMISVGKKYVDQVNAEWKERVASWKCEDGIFLYRMHYYTNYLFNLVEQCFKNRNCGIWEYVIPLESFEKKSEQTPLMISEIILSHISELIVEKMIENKTCTITIFDTMSVTGKTMDSMRNIVNGAVRAAKCKLSKQKISFKNQDFTINEVILFDMQTCRYEEVSIKTNSYYHFDVPRMGSKEKCPLCTAIETCIDSKRLINSRIAKERIDTWIDGWKAVSPIHSAEILGNAGKRSVVDLEGKECHFSVFAMQLVEMSYLNNDRNFIYDVCIKKDDLTPGERLVLLSIQILLFPQNDSYKHYNEVYSELFYQMNRIEEANMATALAAMVGIRANEATVKHALNVRFNGFDHLANEDIKIMMAILFGEHEALQSSSYYFEVADLLKESQKVDLELLKTMHAQLYNVHGEAHSTRLDKIRKPFGDYKMLANYCDSVCYCLEKLYSIVDDINPLLIRCEEADNEELYYQQNERKNLLKIIENAEKTIIAFKQEVIDSQRSKLTEDQIETVKNEIEAPLQKFHRKLFIPYGKSEVSKDPGVDIEETLLRIMADVSLKSYSSLQEDDPRKLKAGVEENSNRVFYYYDAKNKRELKYFLEFPYLKDVPEAIKEVWYIWNHYIVDEMSYLFGDIRHSFGVVNHRTYDDLNLVARVYADVDKLTIDLESYSQLSDAEIKKRVAINHRYQKEELGNFNISIDYVSEKVGETTYKLHTIVIIPAIEGGKNEV